MSLAIPYRHDVTWYLLGTGRTHMVFLFLLRGVRGKAEQRAVYLAWTIGPVVGVLDEPSCSQIIPLSGVAVIGPPVYIG